MEHMAHHPRRGRPGTPRRPISAGRNARPSSRSEASRGIQPFSTADTANTDSSEGEENSSTSPAPAAHPPRSASSSTREKRVFARTTPRTSPSTSSATTRRREERRKQRERDAARAKERDQRVADGKSFVVGGLEVSVRFLGIGLLAVILALMLIPSIYQWWHQEQEYRAIQARVEEVRANNQEMRDKLDLWSNPEYVASQARERLGYVKKGETQYSVLDPGPGYQDQVQLASTRDQGPARPWVNILALTATEADHPTGTRLSATTESHVPAATESPSTAPDQQSSNATPAPASENSEQQSPAADSSAQG